MSCTNCFSGCVETTSDKCVKYTGVDISFLSIHTGDPLEAVEKAITDYLATVFTGVGILPIIEPTIICDIVKQYFPCAECGDPTLVDILTAIIKAICDLEALITAEHNRIDVIEGSYAVDCINVDPNAGTHEVLEAVITALCTAIGDITTLENLYATCITTGNINTYIENYLNSISTANLMYTKMVPNVIYPFHPTPAMMVNFGVTGAGTGAWQKIYLCNGLNGTPDLRGRSLIGTTSGMGGAGFDSAVDPGLAGNPAYSLGTTNGQNSVVLSPLQVAQHTHIATASVDEHGGHVTSNKIFVSTDNWANANAFPFPPLAAKPILKVNGLPASDGAGTEVSTTSSVKDLTGITVGVTNAVNDGGQAHTNVSPVHAVYFIIYLI